MTPEPGDTGRHLEGASMNDLCTYLIQLDGRVNVDELNPMSPHHMTPVRSEPAGTLFSICTDQSGMIGLLRHLHSLGFVFLSVARQPDLSASFSESEKE